MKKHLLILALLGMTLHAQTLTVVATGVKNNQGEVQFSLYNKAGTIPDKHLNQYYKMKRTTIQNKTASMVFENLPKGRYAVSIFHDENNNGKVDKGLMLPKEGVGLSNYKTINFFNLPNFKKASFLLNQDKEVKIRIIYL